MRQLSKNRRAKARQAVLRLCIRSAIIAWSFPPFCLFMDVENRASECVDGTF